VGKDRARRFFELRVDDAEYDAAADAAAAAADADAAAPAAGAEPADALPLPPGKAAELVSLAVSRDGSKSHLESGWPGGQAAERGRPHGAPAHRELGGGGAAVAGGGGAADGPAAHAPLPSVPSYPASPTLRSPVGAGLGVPAIGGDGRPRRRRRDLAPVKAARPGVQVGMGSAGEAVASLHTTPHWSMIPLGGRVYPDAGAAPSSADTPVAAGRVREG
jgi:hypothetical protein